MAEALNEAQRYPLLTPEGRRLLQWLHECEYAPRYNHHCGNRLSAAGLRRVQAFAELAQTEPPRWTPEAPPAWLADWVAFCLRTVPFYRRAGSPSADWTGLPTCTRADLAREPWAFVPDTQPLDDLILYATSGVTGHPLNILSHPEASACYQPLLQAALAGRGVRLTGGAGRVACVLVCVQRSTYTYASLAPWLGDAGFVKLNLNPADWRDPADIVKFLEACQPELYTGDPLAFAELARLPLTARPKALVSTAMALTAGLGQRLEQRFGCPVLDTYSLNEAGLVAVAGPGGHWVLPPRTYVEVVDAAGRPCPPGEPGEIALTGGYNPFIPLLRYRTGDYASLQFMDGRPVLAGLAGRPPVVFRGRAGQPINNIDVSHALNHLALPQYTLHQSAEGALHLRARGRIDPAAARAALLALFGADQPLTIEELAAGPAGKLIQYTSALLENGASEAEPVKRAGPGNSPWPPDPRP
jgi:phenylacetate-CoA ligase